MAPMTAAFIADIGHFAAARGLDHRLQASLWVRVIKASDFTDRGSPSNRSSHEMLGTGPRSIPASWAYEMPTPPKWRARSPIMPA